MVVIPNGFELERFHPDAAARARVRQELELGDDTPVVGLVARVHPDKDHPNFVTAAGMVAERSADAVFVLAGQGAERSNADLGRAIRDAGLDGRVRLLGRRADVPSVLAALDVLASSSRSEGFPQVVGEAMLCGVPCAVTDCGDSREIVGRTGRVVPTRDPAALANALLELLASTPAERAALGAEARERIRARYDIASVSRRYVELYGEVARAHGGPAAT
jgi:glycosyltransferase involved in cell wall biosynthesis